MQTTSILNTSDMISIIAIVVSICLFVFGIVFAVIGSLLKKSIVDKLDQAMQKVDGLAENLNLFKQEILKDYVRKEDFSENEVKHREMWIELNALKRETTEVKTEQKHILTDIGELKQKVEGAG